jgi:hypothetical protein
MDREFIEGAKRELAELHRSIPEVFQRLFVQHDHDSLL